LNALANFPIFSKMMFFSARSIIPKQTFGCRHTLPRICGKHFMPKKCAFVNADGICYAPPKSWKKQFLKLSSKSEKQPKSTIR
jgi:hypothetical protein